MNTGYFIQNGNNIMKGIDERFTQAFKDIQTAFETVRTDFRNEWVGSDEISFENKLVEKLNLQEIKIWRTFQSTYYQKKTI